MQRTPNTLRAWFLVLAIGAATARAEDAPYCGDTGVWLQILGSGGIALEDDRGSASYLVWLDEEAKLLVDAGPGSSVRFGEAGAKLADLEAIVLTQLRVDHTGDLASIIAGSADSERDRALPILGPEGNEAVPATTVFIERLIGPEGLYDYLADYLTPESPSGYMISPRDVPATGQRRWSRFGTRAVRLTAIPVSHGDIPAIAWRVEIDDFVLVFSGDFSNQKNVMSRFAKDADALVVTHAISESTRGPLRDSYATPSQLGRVAAQANARMLVLGHREPRTLGLESVNRKAIEAHFSGPLVFANELECWGL